MTYSACDGSFVPDWLCEYHDWMKWASRVNPWPHQARRPNPPPSDRAAVAKPLSGAEALALLEQRRDTTNHYTGKVTTS